MMLSLALAFVLFSKTTRASEIDILAKPAEITKSGAFCFTREESENIYSCLKMQDLYRENIRAALLDTPDFLDTIYGKAALIGLGVAFGYSLGHR